MRAGAGEGPEVRKRVRHIYVHSNVAVAQVLAQGGVAVVRFRRGGFPEPAGEEDQEGCWNDLASQDFQRIR